MNDKVCLPTLNENYCERVYARGEEPEAYAVGCESLPPAEATAESAYTCVHLTDEAPAPLRWGLSLRNFFWSPAPSDEIRASGAAADGASLAPSGTTSSAGVEESQPAPQSGVVIKVHRAPGERPMVAGSAARRAMLAEYPWFSRLPEPDQMLWVAAAVVAAEAKITAAQDSVAVSYEEIDNKFKELHTGFKVIYGSHEPASAAAAERPVGQEPTTARNSSPARPRTQGSRPRSKPKPKKTESDAPLY